MARYRRYIRKSFKKRNAERVIRGGTSSVSANTQQIAYTYTATEACTVKSIKLDIGSSNATEDNYSKVQAYVLALVPEGYNANPITYPALTEDMYNPTNFVLISGILTDAVVEDHKYNMIGRKMKKGDRLALIIANKADGSHTISFEISFSVLT